jgi:excinuclease ABC subunit C
VYAFFDGDERPIYVGMSQNLNKRLLSYFFDRPTDVKERRIATRSCRLGWESLPHTLTASLRELELIRRWKPAYNVKGRSDRFRTGYLYLTTEAAPRLKLAESLPRGTRRWWGPMPIGRQTEAALHRLNYAFGIADCASDVTIAFRDQAMLFAVETGSGCMRAATATCAAPCAGRCSRSEYAALVERACNLLDGQSDEKLTELDLTMRKAAANRRFEHAAALRDTLKSLEFLRDQVRTLSNVRQDYWFVYPIAGRRTRTWYLLAGGVIVAAAREPQSAKSAQAWLDALACAQPRVSQEAQAEDFAQMFLLAGWFRKHPREREKILTTEEATERCRKLLS